MSRGRNGVARGRAEIPLPTNNTGVASGPHLPWRLASVSSIAFSLLVATMACARTPLDVRKAGRRRARMIWLLAIPTVVALLGAALWTAPRWLIPQIVSRAPRCLFAVTTNEKVIALTFDDGPDRQHTREILRLLEEQSARATFFLISGNVAGAEPIVTEIVGRGHEVGNHLTHDEPSIRISPPEFVAAVREAGSVLSRFGPVRWLRPGAGWYNRTMVDAIEREGYRCALGSVYPFDGYGTSVRLASAYILANTRPGAVIVLHEGGGRGARTVAVLRRVLPALRKRGYRVVTLSKLDSLSSR